MWSCELLSFEVKIAVIGISEMYAINHVMYVVVITREYTDCLT
jgi:hypothetical protein